MARKLTNEDLLILKKLAPELTDTACGHSGHEFRSVLPPVSQHFSSSQDNFRERLVKLSDGELNYLVSLIFEGWKASTALKRACGCPRGSRGMRLSRVKATELLELYKFAGD